MGRIRKGRSERGPRPRFTDEYLNQIRHKITPRDMSILELLDQHSIMSSRHLYDLCPGVSGLPSFYALAKGQQRLNDRLRVLYDAHLVNKASPLLPPGCGTSCQYAWLDRGGIKLIGSTRAVKYHLPATYLHTVLLLDVWCALVRREREGLFELRYLVKEKPQHTWPVIPDLLVLFRKGNEGYWYAIEVDRCEKPIKEEVAKIQAYHAWRHSTLWLREPWVAFLPQPRFPFLLYLFDPHKPVWKKRKQILTQTASACGLPFRAMLVGEFLQQIIER